MGPWDSGARSTEQAQSQVWWVLQTSWSNNYLAAHDAMSGYSAHQSSLSHVLAGKLPYTGRDPRIKEGPEYLTLGPRRTDSPSRNSGLDTSQDSGWADLGLSGSPYCDDDAAVASASLNQQPSLASFGRQSGSQISAFYPHDDPSAAQRIPGVDTCDSHPVQLTEGTSAANSGQAAREQPSPYMGIAAESIASFPWGRSRQYSTADDIGMDSARLRQSGQSTWHTPSPVPQQVVSQHGYPDQLPDELAARQQQQLLHANWHPPADAPAASQQTLTSLGHPPAASSTSSWHALPHAGASPMPAAPAQALHQDHAQQHGMRPGGNLPSTEAPAVWQLHQHMRQLPTAREHLISATPAAVWQQRQHEHLTSSQDASSIPQQQQALELQHTEGLHPLVHHAGSNGTSMERTLQQVGRVSAELEPYWRSPAEGPRCSPVHAGASNSLPHSAAQSPFARSIDAAHGMTPDDVQAASGQQLGAQLGVPDQAEDLERWQGRTEPSRGPARHDQPIQPVGLSQGQPAGASEQGSSRQMAGYAQHAPAQQHASELPLAADLEQGWSSERVHRGQHAAEAWASDVGSSREVAHLDPRPTVPQQPSQASGRAPIGGDDGSTSILHHSQQAYSGQGHASSQHQNFTSRDEQNAGGLSVSAGLGGKPLSLARTLSDHDPGHLLSASPLTSRHTSQQLIDTQSEMFDGTINPERSMPSRALLTQGLTLEQAVSSQGIDAVILASRSSRDSYCSSREEHEHRPEELQQVVDIRMEAEQGLSDSQELASDGSGESMVYEFGGGSEASQETRLLQPTGHHLQLAQLSSFVPGDLAPASLENDPNMMGGSHSRDHDVAASALSAAASYQKESSTCPEQTDDNCYSAGSTINEDALPQHNLMSPSGSQTEDDPVLADSPIPGCSEEPLPQNGRPLGPTWGEQRTSTTTSHLSPLQAGLMSGRHSEEWAQLPFQDTASCSETNHAAGRHEGFREAHAGVVPGQFDEGDPARGLGGYRGVSMLSQTQPDIGMGSNATLNAFLRKDTPSGAQGTALIPEGISNAEVGAVSEHTANGPLGAGMSFQGVGRSDGVLEATTASPSTVWEESISDQVSGDCYSAGCSPEDLPWSARWSPLADP